MKWTKIDNHPNYSVSNTGLVRNDKTGRILKHHVSNSGYLYVNIQHDMCYVHRLVAKAFLPQPKHKPCVNHINGDKQDPRVENLEWVDYYENRWHAKYVLHQKGNCKRVRCVETGVVYLSISDARRAAGVCHQYMTECLQGKRDTCGGLHWEVAI